MKAFALGVAALIGAMAPAGLAGERDTKVLGDRDTVNAMGRWIYNDLPKGFAAARQSGKPLLVVLRCIP
jgi:hypothetical protein